MATTVVTAALSCALVACGGGTTETAQTDSAPREKDSIVEEGAGIIYEESDFDDYSASIEAKSWASDSLPYSINFDEEGGVVTDAELTFDYTYHTDGGQKDGATNGSSDDSDLDHDDSYGGSEEEHKETADALLAEWTERYDALPFMGVYDETHDFGTGFDRTISVCFYGLEDPERAKEFVAIFDPVKLSLNQDGAIDYAQASDVLHDAGFKDGAERLEGVGQSFRETADAIANL